MEPDLVSIGTHIHLRVTWINVQTVHTLATFYLHGNVANYRRNEYALIAKWTQIEYYMSNFEHTSLGELIQILVLTCLLICLYVSMILIPGSWA